jgi:hypothetical protein
MIEPAKNKIKIEDRILILVLCVVFTIGFGSAYFAINAWQPNDTFERVLKFLGREIGGTILLFTCLVFIRCFISSPQLDKKLDSVTMKMLVSTMLVACALTVLLFLALLSNF